MLCNHKGGFVSVVVAVDTSGSGWRRGGVCGHGEWQEERVVVGGVIRGDPGGR